jgi:hypothetical protein
MLYEAYSNAPTTQRCPTCVRPFVLQPWDDPLSDDPSDTPLGEMCNLLALATTSILSSAPCTATVQFYSYVSCFQLIVFLSCLAQFCKDSNPPPVPVFTNSTKQITDCSHVAFFYYKS